MPRTTSSGMFFYVYVLESLKDGERYVGYTNDLRRRIEEHAQGESRATKVRRPFQMIYYEACSMSEDAKRRERFFKTTQGRRFLGLRLKAYARSRALGIRR